MAPTTTARFIMLLSTLTLIASATHLHARGDTISLLFLNTTAQPLTAYVQKAVANGPTTYIINCESLVAADCTIHDATLTVNPGLSYDLHSSINSGGALTIHCTYAADGRTPIDCTRTVAGGPNGYDITTSTPTRSEWNYLPVKLTKVVVDKGAYTIASQPSAITSYLQATTGTASASPTAVSVQTGAACVSVPQQHLSGYIALSLISLACL